MAAATVLAVLLPVALGSLGDGLTLFVANLMAMHAVNAYGTRRTAIVGSAAVGAAAAIGVVTQTIRTEGDLVWGLALFGLAAASGQVMSANKRTSARAQAQAESAAVDAERRVVAADLHDIVAHGLALMVVQAGAAASVIDRDPERARRLLDGVQDTGARSAAELSHLLDVLAPGRSAVAPTPGIEDLTALVDQARVGGLAVELELDGDMERVPAGLATSVYRLVQEALTNAIKHATGDSVSVAVRGVGAELRVVIEDRGRAGREHLGDRSGHGLAAMRERVALFGGTVRSGPTTDGWRVSAAFPLDRQTQTSGDR